MAELPDITKDPGNELVPSRSAIAGETPSAEALSTSTDDGPPIYAQSDDGDTAIRQGEIISNLIQVSVNLEALTNGELKGDQITHPYAIVLTQDCDCIQDFRARRASGTRNDVPCILFGELHAADWMRDKGNSMKIDSDIWKSVKQNKNERYQFLQLVPPELDREGTGLPELIVDFRRFFALPTDEVYLRISLGEAKRRCRLVSPYLEHFGSRFSFFCQRVALPRDHESI